MPKPITMLDLCKIDPEKAAERIEALIKRNAELEKNLAMLENYNGSVESLIKEIEANNLEQRAKALNEYSYSNKPLTKRGLNLESIALTDQAKALKDPS
jgi:hypothetical protein